MWGDILHIDLMTHPNLSHSFEHCSRITHHTAEPTSMICVPVEQFYLIHHCKLGACTNLLCVIAAAYSVPVHDRVAWFILWIDTCTIAGKSMSAISASLSFASCLESSAPALYDLVIHMEFYCSSCDLLTIHLQMGLWRMSGSILFVLLCPMSLDTLWWEWFALCEHWDSALDHITVQSLCSPISSNGCFQD